MLIAYLRRNAIACLALFVALGGTGYAAIAIPRNSVGTAQLKKGAVTGAKVKAHSLVGSDFKPGQLPAGPRGEAGAKGEAGPKGEAGAPGAALGYAHVVVVSGTATIDPSRSHNVVQANLTHVANSGIYCFSGLSFTPHNAIVGPDAAASDEEFTAEAGLAPDEKVLAACGSSAQVAVATEQVGKGNVDTSFYILFD
jgi:hypothetical protein